MSRTEPPSSDSLRLAFFSSAVAGCVDAIGFLKLGGLFVSFMGGTTTQLSVFLILPGRERVISAALLVLLFVGGAMLGEVVGWAAGEVRRRAAMLSVVAALLLLATLAAFSARIGPTIGLTVLAMGMQNAVVHRIGGVEIGPTFITGLLTRLGQGIAHSLTGRGGAESWAPLLLLWVGLVAGGALGALLYARFGVLALSVPALIALLLALGEQRRAALGAV